MTVKWKGNGGGGGGIILVLYACWFNRLAFYETGMQQQQETAWKLFFLCKLLSRHTLGEETQRFFALLGLFTQVLSALPSWFRMAQCLRCYYDTKQKHHLANAGKYFSTFPMVVMASLVAENKASGKYNDWRQHPEFFIWLSFALLHAVYVYVWDIVMDWGLLRQQPYNPHLRAHLLYRRPSLYYCAIFIDFILRFVWTMKMSISVSTWFGSDEMLILLAIAEVLRRFLWNFFRLEFEQTKSLEEPLVVDYSSTPSPALEMSDRASVESPDVP